MKRFRSLLCGTMLATVGLAGCGANSGPSYNRAITPAPTVIIQSSADPVAVTSPPSLLTLNQPYEFAPLRVTVTHFDNQVDPNTPDIKNSGNWRSFPTYRWVSLDCLMANTSAVPVAPFFWLMGAAPGESYSFMPTIINGYAIEGVLLKEDYSRYLRLVTIAPYTTVHLRLYFYLEEHGSVNLAIGPFDPGQDLNWNEQNRHVENFFTVQL